MSCIPIYSTNKTAPLEQGCLFITNRCLFLISCNLLPYSVLKFFTGLLHATLIACMLIVKNAIKKAIDHAEIIIQTLNGALYAKLSSHRLMKYHAMGDAIKNEMN